MYIRLPWVRSRYLKYLRNLPKDYCFICDSIDKGKYIDYGEFVVIKNDYPYIFFSRHLLISPKKHVNNFTQDMLPGANKIILENYEEEYWTFQNISKNRSVCHAHWHIVTPRGSIILRFLYRVYKMIDKDVTL